MIAIPIKHDSMTTANKSRSTVSHAYPNYENALIVHNRQVGRPQSSSCQTERQCKIKLLHHSCRVRARGFHLHVKETFRYAFDGFASLREKWIYPVRALVYSTNRCPSWSPRSVKGGLSHYGLPAHIPTLHQSRP